jgi:hypothetical protein
MGISGACASGQPMSRQHSDRRGGAERSFRDAEVAATLRSARRVRFSSSLHTATSCGGLAD